MTESIGYRNYISHPESDSDINIYQLVINDNNPLKFQVIPGRMRPKVNVLCVGLFTGSHGVLNNYTASRGRRSILWWCIQVMLLLHLSS